MVLLNSRNESFVSNIKGKKMAKSPELTVNMSLSQSFKNRYGEMGYLLAINYQDDYYLSIFNGRGINEVTGERAIGLYDLQQASTTYDFGIYFSKPDNFLRVEAYVNNLSDERIANSSTKWAVCLGPLVPVSENIRPAFGTKLLAYFCLASRNKKNISGAIFEIADRKNVFLSHSAYYPVHPGSGTW